MRSLKQHLKRIQQLLMKQDEKPRHVYEEKPSQKNFLYRVEDVAKILTKEKPFFKMHSGGVYAVALTGGIPTHFVRVDKDRRPWRLVRLERRLKREEAHAIA